MARQPRYRGVRSLDLGGSTLVESEMLAAGGIWCGDASVLRSTTPTSLTSLPAGSDFVRRVACEDLLQPLELLRDQPPGPAGHNPPRNPAEQTIEQIDS